MSTDAPWPSRLIRDAYGVSLATDVGAYLDATVNRSVGRAVSILQNQPVEMEGFVTARPDAIRG